MVTSNCLTGKAEYFEEKKDKKRLVDICKASCTLPILCPITYVDGIPMVDGGVCDAIPIRRAIADGFSKNELYADTFNQCMDKGMAMLDYREQLRLRYRQYNEVLDYIDQLEAEGKAFVIRPQSPIKVGRTGSDTKKLEELYEEGYECGKQITQL